MDRPSDTRDARATANGPGGSAGSAPAGADGMGRDGLGPSGLGSKELGSNGLGSNGLGSKEPGSNGLGSKEAGSNGVGSNGHVDEIDRVLPAMRGLRSRARVTNLSRAAQLERSLELAAEGRLDEAGRAQAAAVAHQLIGSAGTFGFPEASRAATELREFFTRPQLDDDDVRLAQGRLTALRDDLQNGDSEIEF
ncbi:Hpt domain-containing protein [Microlunatus ginsengisoli]|uniref:HPt domain-containing protein n=1 Tax=Microlunatus ginsengisoli TaxID=363863 RepID=A0ABP6ZTZ4_9ACTN